MKILFAHQNFPGQFSRLCTYLPRMGHEVVFMSRETSTRIDGVRQVFYDPLGDSTPGVHPYVVPFEESVLMGQVAARAAAKLKAEGFTPDIIVGHTAWGETLFLKTIFPHVPVLNFLEFFHKAHGADYNFDPEFPFPALDEERVIAKNAANLVSWNQADWGYTATEWQRSLFPADMQSRITVIHEGVLTDEIRPNPDQRITLKSGRTYTPQDHIVTFVARNLEPYRGFHTMMRAVPEILRRHPEAIVAFVGGDDISYGPRHGSGRSWKQIFLDEVAIDRKRVWFTGPLAYEQYLALLQLSAAHVYLTYPFVLSWSMLEAMSAGCAIIGSRTGPVEEVIEHRRNGLLVDFFKPGEVADAVTEVFSHPDRMAAMRQAARQTAIDRYDVKTISLPRTIELLQDLVAGRRPQLY